MIIKSKMSSYAKRITHVFTSNVSRDAIDIAPLTQAAYLFSASPEVNAQRIADMQDAMAPNNSQAYFTRAVATGACVRDLSRVLCSCGQCCFGLRVFGCTA